MNSAANTNNFPSTPYHLLADYNAAITLAISDLRSGDGDRWLRHLITLGPDRARRYPTEKRGFLAAMRRAQRALK